MNRTTATLITSDDLTSFSNACYHYESRQVGTKNPDPSPDFLVAQGDRINNLDRLALVSSSHR
jgi:hypothetical protein